MKRKLAFTLVMVMLFSVPSFSLTKEKPIIKKELSKKKAAPKKIKLKVGQYVDCGYVTGFTVVSLSSSSITISWTHTGTPTSYNYGGYWNTSGPYIPFPTVNTTASTATISIPSAATGGRVGVAAVCSDGQPTTNPCSHSIGALFFKNGSVSYFGTDYVCQP